jgi:hypothetical protein
MRGIKFIDKMCQQPTAEPAHFSLQNRAQVHHKTTGYLVPFSPRRVLPRFVNPSIGSKLLRLSI